MISHFYSLISFHRLYAVCCVHPLPNFGLVFCDFISVTEFFTMLFCYFWGHVFFPASRDAVWRLALPPSKGERGTPIIMRFRRRDGIWSCVRYECCLLVQKRNRRAGVKPLFFNLIVFILSVVYLHVFFYHLLSLLNILLFYKKSVNWIDTILIIITLSAYS